MLNLDFPKLWRGVTDASRLPNSPIRAVAVRGANTPKGQQNSFAHYDDLIFIEIDGVVKAWVGSTDPAWALVVHPIVAQGAAQLCEGVHLFGPVLMHGKYPCFGQIENVHVNRLDTTGKVKYVDFGFFGIDLHSGGEGMDTGRFSAGCQIIQNPDGYFQNPFWNTFYHPLRQALQKHGLSKFPYMVTTLAKLQQGGVRPLTAMRAFGPLHQSYPSERGFDVSKHLTFGAGDPFAHSRVWNFDQEPPPDQTGSQECLAFWLAATVACDPFNRPMPNPDALYAAMCKIDGRPHDPDTGSTVQAAVQVAKDHGYLGSVLFTKGAVDLWNFITQHGPAGLALPWFQDMMMTNDDGSLSLPSKMDASQALGGHIILLNGTQVRDEPEFCAVNWFGPMWGFNGRCTIKYPDMCRLLDMQSTIALCPTKTQYTAK